MEVCDMNWEATKPRNHNWKGKTAENESREFTVTLLALHCGLHGHPDHRKINTAQPASPEIVLMALTLHYEWYLLHATNASYA
jgi:hypothetical protein